MTLILRWTGCLFLLLMTTRSYAQPVTPEDYNLKACTLHHPSLGDIRYYITTRELQTRKPLLILLEGSGHFPLAVLVKETHRMEVMNTFDQDMLKMADHFHVVMIGKPGIPFCDTIQVNGDTAGPEIIDSLLPMPTIYRQRSSLTWRAQAASAVIDAVCARFPVNRAQIVIYGYSEGAQVAPKVAVINKKVTHCASVFGAGLNQLYDFIIDARLEALKGHITYAAAQQRVDSLMQVFADIYRHPGDTRKEWEGHTYQRWAGYGTELPLHNFSRLSIPLFIAAGMHDRNSLVYGLDYVPLEFLRLGKTNLTYKVYPTDHFFRNTMDSQDTIHYKQQMLQDLLQWLKMASSH